MSKRFSLKRYLLAVLSGSAGGALIFSVFLLVDTFVFGQNKVGGVSALLFLYFLSLVFSFAYSIPVVGVALWPFGLAMERLVQHRPGVRKAVFFAAGSIVGTAISSITTPMAAPYASAALTPIVGVAWGSAAAAAWLRFMREGFSKAELIA